jgi:DNA polymerase/3'-5' exonuclease PolX
MELERAGTIAENCVAILRPFCERIEIAGSIRRRRPIVGDIEIVCIPRGKEMYGFVETVNKWYKLKGEPTGKYTRRLLPEGIKLDLFIANRDNWGLIFAIRTGNAKFSHEVLAIGWKKKGFESRNGILFKPDATKTFIREEKELFDLIGIPYVVPEMREIR